MKTKEAVLIIITILIILYIIHCHHADEINRHYYLASLIILLILIPILYWNNLKIFSLIILFFLIFTLYFYIMFVLYSLSPYINGDFVQWNHNMKSLTSAMFDVEVIGRQDYGQPVIYALQNNHNMGFSDYLSFGFIDPEAKIVIKKGNWSKMLKNNAIEINFINNGKNKGNNYDQFIEKSTENLNKGSSLIIFPEGRYSKIKQLNISKWKYLSELQRGCFDLAINNNTLIVPVIVEKYCAPGWLFARGKFKIHFLKPLDNKCYNSATSIKKSFKNRINKKLKKI